MKSAPARPSVLRRLCQAGALILVLNGCRSADVARTRADDALIARDGLARETAAVLARHTNALTLADCLALARERNLALTTRRLHERLARLDRQTAFSAFLPRVEYEFNLLNLSEPAQKQLGNGPVETQDQNTRAHGLRIVQPVFAPSAWLMYRSARRGADLSRLARERTEQLLDLQVINLFHQHAVLADRLAAARHALAAADALDRESAALFEAGYLLEADRRKIETARTAREQEINTLARQVETSRGRLLQVLNLWPLATLAFDTDSLVRTAPADWDTARPVEDWILTALTNRLDLFAADQTIALRKNEIARAIALFLPSLYGFANFYNTSDSYTVNDQYWGSGLQGTLSVFAGFRDVNAYRAARAQLKRAYVEREDLSLATMLQVLEAWRVLQDADGQCAVARQATRAAELDRAAVRAARTEGTAAISDDLRATAAYESAAATLRASEQSRAVALYVFHDAVGLNKDVQDEKD